MLDRSEIDHIRRNFAVYDQSWDFYCGFLGEPHFIEDCLVYFDGRILYICAFPLTDPYCELPLASVMEILSKFASDSVEGVNIWGRLPVLPTDLLLPQGHGRCFSPVEDEYEFDSGEHVIDLLSFDYANLPKARKSLRRAHRAQVYSRVVTRDYLTATHIKLLRRFLETHTISSVHAASYLSIQQLLSHPNTIIVESYFGDTLVGFKVIVLSGSHAATSICGFYDSFAARGASDISMAAAIEYCQQIGCQRLHMGYSATPSLIAFKEKWGATRSGPAYKEAFYYLTDPVRHAFERGEFLWRENLYMGVVERNNSQKDES
jgi:hypothetical protein